MNKCLLFLATFSLSLTLSVAAQESPYYAGCGKYTGLVFGYSGDLSSDPNPAAAHFYAGDRLESEFGIRSNKEDLRSALHNDDLHVRYLAAWVLADQNEKDVIPEIFHALEGEKVPRVRAYLACALAELGDPRGAAALHQYCEKGGLPSDVKLDVVRFLAELHETPCITSVVEALKGGPPGNWQALTIIPNIKGLSPEESAQLHAVLLGSLSDPGPAVRLVAAQTIAQMHDSSAIPSLQVALAKECNPKVRSAMQAALDALQVEGH